MQKLVGKFHTRKNEDGVAAMRGTLVMVAILPLVAFGALSITSLFQDQGYRHIENTVTKIEPYKIQHPTTSDFLVDGISYTDLAEQVNNRNVPLGIDNSKVLYTELEDGHYELCITEGNEDDDFKYSTVTQKLEKDVTCH